MKSIIIGAGTYGEVYLTYLQEANIEVVGFLDDNPKFYGRKICGVPVLGDISILNILRTRYGIEAVYCPIGDNQVRAQILQRAKTLGYATPNYIHPSVIVSPYVSIGEGVYILLGSTIMPYTIIKNYTMISMGVHIAHHSVIEEGCFFSTGCNFGASITAHKFSYCGISSTIMTGIKELGENCLIGAGAVVIHDVEPNSIVAGVPAKEIRKKTTNCLCDKSLGGVNYSCPLVMSHNKNRNRYAA